MIIIGLLVLLILGDLFILKRYDYEIAMMVIIVVGFLLLFALVSLPLSYYTIQSNVAEFHSVEETVQHRLGSIESAAIEIKVVDSNKWLAGIQYWNKTLLDIWIPDQVDMLKPITLK
jgi:hypothetical protein